MDPTFKFTASTGGEVEPHNDWVEPRISGDRRATSSLPEAKVVSNDGKVGEYLNLKVNPDEHCQSTRVGYGDIIVGEQSSPCSSKDSVYDDTGYDRMVSEEGDGVPPSD